MADDDAVESLDPEDYLDGEDGIPSVAATADDEIDGLVLFADVDPADVDAIERRVAEWQDLFGAP